ncbi:GNAT family N-acetyltransferase [Paenibacillus nicotianae]|uniref:GNAT family N-acetyltransferase n=1 Tax=Paenibacillus nicotianae TaxID=1526551 RepID=A0ABW4UUJ4_9BACL
MNLKAATEQDASFLFTLFEAQKTAELGLDNVDIHFKNSIISMQWNSKNQSYLHRFPDLQTFVILYEEQAVGSCMIHYTPQEIHMIDILISSSFRNLSIGTLLFKQLQLEAQQQKIPLRLQVAIGNPAQRLYERLGFNIYQSDQVYLSMEWIPSSSQSTISC